jgi:calcium-dependent protein kinase
MHQTYGTPYYIAPEILAGEYTEKCDVWSAGVLLYIMLCGYPPFNAKTDAEIYKKIQIGEFSFDKNHFKDISEKVKI